jgi:hypothetical protein
MSHKQPTTQTVYIKNLLTGNTFTSTFSANEDLSNDTEELEKHGLRVLAIWPGSIKSIEQVKTKE